MNKPDRHFDHHVNIGTSMIQKGLMVLIASCTLAASTSAEHSSERKIDQKVHTSRIERDFWNRYQSELSTEEFDSTLHRPRTVLDSSLNYAYYSFLSHVDLSFFRCKSEVDFKKAKFDSTVTFLGSCFDSPTNFELTHFYGNFINFNRAIFVSITQFKEAHFVGRTGFEGAHFLVTPSFQFTRFDTETHFNFATFDSSADFSFSQFGTFASFRNARFGKRVDFNAMTLPDYLDFRDVTLSTEIDLSKCIPPVSGKKCRIALYGTDIEKVKLSMELFQLEFPLEEKTEWVTDEEHELMVRAYGALGRYYPRPEQLLSFYQLLLKKMADDGFESSYEIVDKEYRSYKAGISSTSGQISHNLQRLWWDFGYAKERIFYFSFSFWLLISILNLRFYSTLQKELYSIEFLEVSGDLETGLKRRTKNLFRVLTYTAIVFFGLRMDIDKFQGGALRNHPWLFAYLMLVYTVGLICIGFVANIVFTT